MNKLDLSHIKYLYAENKDAAAVLTVLIIPAMAMTFGLMWIGYDLAVPVMSTIPAVALTISMVCLAVYAVSEVAPIMPSQWLENKLRYKRVGGWAYLALAVAMTSFIYNQLLARWQAEPAAAAIAYLPEALAALGVTGGVFVLALLISIHRLPSETHQRIIEAQQVDDYTNRTERIRDRRWKVVSALTQRAIKPGPLNQKQEASLGQIVNEFKRDVDQIEMGILDVISWKRGR